MRPKTPYGLLVLFVLAALLACGLPFSSQQSATPEPTVPVSRDAAASMQAKLEEVQQTPPGEEFRLTLTEEELTSFVALQLPQDAQVQDVQVRLRAGAIHISGKAAVGPVTQDLIIAIRPSVRNNAIALEVIEAKVGPMAVPEPLLNTITEQIRETLSANKQVGELKSIEVNDGTLTIVATKQ